MSRQTVFGMLVDMMLRQSTPKPRAKKNAAHRQERI
jgi:hypothetical protein